MDNKSVIGKCATVNFEGKKTSSKVEHSNIVIEKNSNNISFDLDKNIEVDSVKTGSSDMDANGFTVGQSKLNDGNLSIGNITINKDNSINADNKKITGIAAGGLSGTSTDAVNSSQLHATNQNVTDITSKVNQGWKAAVNGNAVQKVTHDNNTLNFADGKNTEVKYDNGSIIIGTKDEVAFDKVTTGTAVMDKDGFAVGDSALTGSGLSVAGNTLDNNGLSTTKETFSGKTYITGNGINANNQKITGVADGAVNVSQLNKVSAEAEKHTSVSSANDNLHVENVAKEGEATNYQIKLSDTVTLGSELGKEIKLDGVNGTVKLGNA